MASKAKQETPRPIVKRTRFTYSSCRHRIARLERYKYLVSHLTRLAPFVVGIPPLEELVPEIKGPQGILLLEREITRLTPIVYWILLDACVPTGITRDEREWEPGPAGPTDRRVTRQYDLVTDFLDHRHDQQHFELLLRVVEEGIGVYQARMEVARSERYNPLVWLAWLIRIPITVMEYAGIIPDNRLVAGLFSVTLQVLMLLIVLFVAIRTGVAIPWETLFRILLKAG